MTWEFPDLKEPSVFIAAPGDMNYLRRSVIQMFHRLKRRVADDHGIQIYDFKTEASETGFKAWKPAQGQIPLPSHNKCVAVICILGERIGTPLSDASFLAQLGDNCPALIATQGPRLIYPWRDDAAAEQGFPLTGTVFEYLTAISANERSTGDGRPPLLFLCVGDAHAPREKRVIDGDWGNRRLYDNASKSIARPSELRDWEDEEYKPQLEQLRNFIRYVQQQKGGVRFVPSEEEALADIQRFLTSELDLRLIEEERNPFKGLDNYDVDDWPVFFGREELRRSVIERLLGLFERKEAANLLRISGGSGCGKSSLMRAGVIGHLTHHLSDGDFCGTVVRPNDLLPELRGTQDGGAQAHESLEEAAVPRLFARVLHNLDSSVDAEEAEKALSIIKPEHQAEEAVRRLADALARRSTNDGEHWRLLIGLDQFEEIVDALCDDARRHVWVPLVVFIEQAARHPDIAILYTLQTNRVPLIDDNYVLHPLMAGTTQEVDFPTSGLDEIINKPFPLKRVTLEPELADELIKRIRSFAVTAERGSLLPLVSVTLSRLYQAYEERRSAHAPLSALTPPRAAAFPTPPETRGRAATERPPGSVRQPEGSGEPTRATDADDASDLSVSEAATAAPSDNVLRLENYQQFLSVEDAIGEAASHALEEAKAIASLSWEEDTVASLLQMLVRRGDRFNSERLAFPSVPLPQGTATRHLAESLAAHRLVAREGPNQFRLVHEAVIRKWEAARDWLRDEQPLLERFEEIYSAARRWQQEGAEEAFLRGMGDQQIQDGAELLARWYNVLKPESSRAESAESLVRDFALAMVAEHREPTREIYGPKRTTRHINVAALYGRADIVRAHLEVNPSAACSTRSDGRTPLFDAAFSGVEETLQLLLDCGAPPGQPDEEGWLPIHSAATIGSVACFETLARRMERLDTPGKGGMTSLHLAVLNNHLQVVERLLADERSDCDIRNERHWTPVHYAAYYGHVEILRLLIERGAALDAQDVDGWTPLHLAAQNDHDAIVGVLLDRDVEIGARLRYDWTPLHLAAFHGRHKTTALLLERGADIEATLKNGCTPLHLAAYKGRDKVARLLVENRAEVNVTCNNDWRTEVPVEGGWLGAGWTPLHFSAEKGQDVITQLLLENGAYVNMPNGDAQMPLHFAAKKGYVTTAQLLLDAGAAVEARDNKQATALHLALAENQYALAQLLVNNKADVEAAQEEALTPLHSAARSGDAVRTLFLLANRANPYARTIDSRTPLHFSAEGGSEEVVRLLLNYSTQVEARDTAERTPLHLAIARGNDAAALLLLERGAEAKAAAKDGTAALHLAAREGRVAPVGLLLDCGAQIDAPDGAGWTPLQIAAQNGHEEVVSLLLARGADDKAVSLSPPLTPLQAAAEVGQSGVVKVLLEHGADIHAENERKGSPLFLAVKNTRYATALQLLEAGADPTLTDAGRKPALGDLLKTNQARRRAAGEDVTATEVQLILRLLDSGISLPVDVVDLGAKMESDDDDDRRHSSTRDETVEPDEGARSAGEGLGGTPKPKRKAFDPLQDDRNVGRDSVVSYPWEHTDADLHLWLRERLNPVDGQLEIMESTQLVVSALPWYQNLRLLRLKDESWPVKKLSLFYLLGDDRTLVRLDGTSPPIYKANADAPIRLSEDNVIDYLRFFCFFVRGSDGIFYVLEEPDDPVLPRHVDTTLQSIIEWTARPAAFERRNEQGDFLCNAVLFFSTALFIAKFVVHPTGVVEMIEDEPIAADLPFKVEAPLTALK